jgi:hypothetical protein
MSLRNDVLCVLQVQESSQTAREIAILLQDAGATEESVTQVLHQLCWQGRVTYDVIGFLDDGVTTGETYWKLTDPTESTRFISRR